MSYEKIRIIDPTSVRNPETSYVYVGYGTYNEFTGMWIKEANGTISVISGGTGGGGGTNYWTKSGSDLSTGTAFGVTGVTINGAKLLVDPTGTGAALSKQALTVNGAIKIGTTSDNFAGSIRYTGTDFEGYITTKGWVSLTASGGTSGTAGTSYWAPLTYGIAPDGYSKIYVGGSFSDATTDEPINSYGGITLGKKSTKPNKEGTIYYTTQGYFVGVSGTSLTDRRLDTFNVNISGQAYYKGTVLINQSTAPSEGFAFQPVLNVTGYTVSNHVVSRYAAPIGPSGTGGGFAGFSGSTLKYGITGSFAISSASDDPGYSDFTVDIVNGLIVSVRGRTAKP